MESTDFYNRLAITSQAVCIGERYNKKYYEEHEFSYRTENRADIGRILELLNPKADDRVLEIGCGLGVLLDRIPAKEKIGIETNDFAVQECRKRGLSVIKANAEKGLPFGESSFDIVIMNEVLEHLKKPEFVLKECFRVLVPGGRIVVTGPACNFFFRNISETHLSEMTVKEMRQLVQNSGFKILVHEVCGISFLYPLLENLLFRPFRVLRSILGRRGEDIQSQEKTVGVIDSWHGLADRTILAPLNSYRRRFLGLGLSQIILAQKV